MMTMMGTMGIGMMLWVLLFIAVIVLVVLLAVRYSRREPGTLGPQKESDGALGILRERYARGEIDSETYQKMKNELK